VELVDQLSAIRRDVDGERVRVIMQARHLVKNKTYRAHALVDAWVAHLAGSLEGTGLRTLVLSPQGMVLFDPVAGDRAGAALGNMLQAWELGMRRPLPVACRTAVAWLRRLGPGMNAEAVPPDHAAWARARDEYEQEAAWCPYLSRAYPDIDALTATGEFEEWALALYGGLADAIQPADGFLPLAPDGEGE
jgi:exodeoxyribonuclease V gamma subunit